MESEQVTAGRGVVVSGDFQKLTESINRATRSLARFSKPLGQVRRAAEMLPRPETVEQWKVVKPAFENAPPRVKRRLGNMTISQAFAVLARHERGRGLVSGRVYVAARAPRSRSGRRVASRARGPDDPPLPPELEVVPLARFWRDVAAWLEAVA